MKIKTLCRSGRQRCHFSIKIGKIVRKSDPDPQNVDHYLCVCVSRGGGGGRGGMLWLAFRPPGGARVALACFSNPQTLQINPNGGVKKKKKRKENPPKMKQNHRTNATIEMIS